MEKYSVLYGKREESFSLPEECSVNYIKANPTQGLINVKQEILRVLNNPVNSPPFSEVFNQGETVVIIVSDYTRASYKFYEFIPILLNELNRLGIPDDKISILMSTGDHREQTREQHLLVVGEEVINRVKIYDHDCMAEDLADLGTTSRGTKVLMNRMVHEADKVLLTGGIAYHLLAGFGGGRKSIAPGVSGYQTIQENHALALKLKEGESLGCGSLSQNPVSLDMEEITALVKPDFLFNVVVNEKKEFIGLTAGNWHDAFLAGTKIVEKAFGIPIKEKADVVIASSGGFPKDVQLYQSIKTLDNSFYAVKEGGSIILVSECSDGPGPDSYLVWFEHDSYADMKKVLYANFTMPGFVALRTKEIITKHDVYLVSGLNKELVSKVGMIPVDSVNKALALINKKQEIKTLQIMPYGSLTFPICE
ncbi:MAG: nickel-dependent lactate racemase [Bacillota bacterium]